MAEARDMSGGSQGADDAAVAGRARRASWREVWQIPALVVALAALGTGVAAVLSLRPKPDFNESITRAEALLGEGKYEESLAELNSGIHPFLEKGIVPQDARRRFHTLVARSIFLWQEGATEKRPENYLNAIGEYIEATQSDAELRAPDAAYLVDSYLALGKLEEARDRLGKLADTPPEIAFGLRKRLIEAYLRAGRAELPHAAEMLSAMLSEPDLTREQRIWAASKQAEAMLAAGAVEEAIARLLRTLPRLAVSGGEGLGELYLHLGEAYLRSGSNVEAEKQLLRASELLDPGSPGAGRAMLLLGRLAAQARNFDVARERFATVLERFAGLPVAGAALLGVGEVDAARGEFGESLDRFAQLVKETREGSVNPDATVEMVTRTLTALAEARFAASDWEHAEAYGRLAETAVGRGEAPVELLELLGKVNLKLAEVGSASEHGAEAGIPRGDAAQAQRDYLNAGEYFREYAARTVLASGRKHADSLWLAADAFDKAGDREGAIAAFQEFADNFPQDARVYEAEFRLARAYQARGQFAKAGELFMGLIARQGPEGAGRFADDSYVPLARNYLLDNDPSNDGKAEELLTTAVSGALGGPDSDSYREALTALADYYYDHARVQSGGDAKGEGGTGRDATEMFARAVTRYDEVLTRFPGTARREILSYRLADACRLGAAVISTRLQEAMLDAQRRDMERTRIELLRRARSTFEKARLALEGMEPGTRSALEDLCLRNSYFYIGDCAFELEDYPGAIGAYDAARERYSGDPSTLVALVQIVNAYMRQGDRKAAAAANEHARRFFASLPEAVWNDPNLPMSRRDWERWLEATSELGRIADAGSKGGDEP